MSVPLLVDWYLKHYRRLPWRQTTDPYSIWVSEVMLQQTQVATVIPYYERFLKRFPNVEALALAEEPEVLTYWSGLGYYSRARNLHRGAKYIHDELRGAFPRTREDILKVPGIGPYTAGAVLSIAYNLPVPLVDGNVQRVFSRYFGERRQLHLKEVQSFFWKKAEEWVTDADSPRFLNQALMELGATVCSRGTPRCEICPLVRSCAAYKAGDAAELPRKKAAKKHVDLWWMGLVIESEGKIFLRKNGKDEWWTELWDFPRQTLKDKSDAPAALTKLLKTYRGVENARPLSIQKHTVTHHRIHVLPYHIELKKPLKLAEPEGKWITSKELSKLPLSSLARKVLSSRVE